MADYSKMYATLFNAVTDAITILQNAQLKTEEQYVESGDPAITVIQPQKLETEE